MIIIKTSQQIRGIRQSCQLAAQTLAFAGSLVKPGVATNLLNDQAHQFIIDRGATPAPLHYKGFPKSICTSVNDVVCHGIPSDRRLKSGDIVNIDITTIKNGYFGDTSATFAVGQISDTAQKLLDRTQTALNLAIKSVKPGKTLDQTVGATIENYVKQFGYSAVRQLGGHGIGLHFHEDPFVYHFNSGFGQTVLKPGMIFTIEPMINASTNPDIKIDLKDGWTVTTTDGSLSAQFEHTLLVTPKGAEVLTQA